jgi:hypothetical protein
MFGTRTTHWDLDAPYVDGEFPLSIAFYDVQPALAASLPAIFVEHLFSPDAHLLTPSYRGQGISQTLIVTRVALFRFAKSPGFTATVNALTSDFVLDGSEVPV